MGEEGGHEISWIMSSCLLDCAPCVGDILNQAMSNPQDDPLMICRVLLVFKSLGKVKTLTKECSFIKIFGDFLPHIAIFFELLLFLCLHLKRYVGLIRLRCMTTMWSANKCQLATLLNMQY